MTGDTACIQHHMCENAVNCEDREGASSKGGWRCGIGLAHAGVMQAPIKKRHLKVLEDMYI